MPLVLKLFYLNFCSLPSGKLNLVDIRRHLRCQEDTIIFYLLERAQFCANAPTYDRDAIEIEGFEGTLVEYMLRETEMLHAKVCYVYSIQMNF